MLELLYLINSCVSDDC